MRLKMLSEQHIYKVEMFTNIHTDVCLSSPVGSLNDVSNFIMTLQLILMLKLSFMNTFVITFQAVQRWGKSGSKLKVHCSGVMKRQQCDGWHPAQTQLKCV